MSEDAIIDYLRATFDDIQTETVSGDTFIFYGDDHRLPLATIVTRDEYDTVSDLNRPGVYRLNIGVGKETFRRLFPAATGQGAADRYDYAAFDQLYPHPVYAQMNWVCMVNPGAATFASVLQPLLAEAYALAARKGARRAARDQG